MTIDSALNSELLSTATVAPSAFLPSVSVVIPIYNGEMDLPELIACLRAQTYPAEKVEYLLVDNASCDRTPAILQALLPQAAVAQGEGQGQAALNEAEASQSSPKDEIRLMPLLEAEIQSSYAARNRGIKTANGEILAFTDADCRPEPNWLLNLVQPFIDPSVGMVAGEILALPGATLLERYADRHETLSQKHTLAHPFLPYGQTANLAIRRQIFTQVGLFRPHLTTGGDADICWRIQQQTPWQIRLAATAIIRHRHRSTWTELQSQWRRYGRSNRYLHELHGIPLSPSLSPRDYLYRWLRWLLKEVPLALAQIPRSGWHTCLDRLLDTPISLLCTVARSTGQQQAQLAAIARQIEEFP